jgi:hypothetical protein
LRICGELRSRRRRTCGKLLEDSAVLPGVPAFINIWISSKDRSRDRPRAIGVVALMGCFRAFFIVGSADVLFKEERQTARSASMRLAASIRTPAGALRNFNIVGLEEFYDRSLP